MQIENLPPVGTKIIIRCAGEDHEVTAAEGGLFDLGDTELTCVREFFEGWRDPGEKVDDEGWRRSKKWLRPRFFRLPPFSVALPSIPCTGFAQA